VPGEAFGTGDQTRATAGDAAGVGDERPSVGRRWRLADPGGGARGSDGRVSPVPASAALVAGLGSQAGRGSSAGRTAAGPAPGSRQGTIECPCRRQVRAGARLTRAPVGGHLGRDGGAAWGGNERPDVERRGSLLSPEAVPAHGCDCRVVERRGALPAMLAGLVVPDS